jgi:membrane-bound lytic murein transglycosylase D
MLVKAGSTLLVPRAAHDTADVAEHIADQAARWPWRPICRRCGRASIKAGQKGRQRGCVARRYRIQRDQLAQLNGVAHWNAALSSRGRR